MTTRRGAWSTLLRERDFRRWFASRSISTAGTAASTVALPVLVYRASGSASLTAAVVGLAAVPYLVFGLFFGALSDRLRRKQMMIAADIGCALAAASIPIADALGLLTSWQVLAVAFAIGIGFCWFDSAAWGALPRLVGKARLTEANSMIWGSSVIVGIAAPAATGLLITTIGPSLILAIDAASYLCSAALIAGVRVPLTADRGTAPRLATDITTGLRYIWQQPVIRAFTTTGFLLAVSGGGAFGLIVVHAVQVLHIPAEDGRIGLLYAASATGGLIATLLLPFAARRVGPGIVSVLAYSVFGAAIALLSSVATPTAGFILWAVWQFAYATAVTNGINVRQQLTPDHMQGRVNTTGRMIAWGGTPFGALLAGTVAQATNARAAFIVLTAPAIAALAILVTSPARTIRIDLGAEPPAMPATEPG